MRLMKSTPFILFSLLLAPAFAKADNLVNYFQNKSGCFILYNVSEAKTVERYNPTHCATRVSADSTFKIALSLMAFDQNIISSKTVFGWNGNKKALPQWNHNQTPKTWLQYSVVWVSQGLTPQLGLSKIKKYLDNFKYGNQDFSGTPRKQDGLTQAWLSNSLKISADEQLDFLKRFITRDLNVSQESIELTKQNLFLEKLTNGWKLYGKTGSGHAQNKMTEGWFVGFVEKEKQKYIFVTNFTSLNETDKPEPGGSIAKTITIKLLGLL